MRHTTWLFGNLLGVFAVVGLSAAPDPTKPSKDTTTEKVTPVKTPTPEEIQSLVKNLGSPRFTVREAASTKLWEFGRLAEPALEKASKDSDQEIATRAKEILDRFQWGVYPDTPKKILDLVEKFRAGEQEVRVQVLGELIKTKPLPLSTIRKLLLKINAEERPELIASLASQAHSSIPEMLEKKAFSDAEDLLELCLIGPTEDTAKDFAAFMFLRGKIDETIKRFALQAQGNAEEAKSASYVLCHLHRIKGDWTSAIKAAKATMDDDLLDAILWEAGDWKALSEAPIPDLPTDCLDGVRAAYLRLAGEQKKFDELITKIRKDAAIKEDEFQIRAAADSLILNGRPEDALNLLLETKMNVAFTVDMLIAQSNYKKALEIANKINAEHEEYKEVEIRRARILYMTGHRDQAIQIFTKIAGGLVESKDLPVAEDLIQLEVRLGLRDLAVDHTTQIVEALAKNEDLDGIDSLLEQLIGAKFRTDAELFWLTLRETHAQEDGSKRMKMLLDLMSGKDRKLLDSLSQSFDKLNEQMDDPVAEIKQRRWAALAHAWQIAGDEKKAEAYYLNGTKKAGSWFLIRFGDFLMDQKRYLDAARRYAEAWELERAEPGALVLQANALKKAGKDKEAAQLLELALWVPLGNETARCFLVQELDKRGLTEEADRQSEMILKTGWYQTYYVGNIYSRMARQAAAKKEYFKAAAHFEKSILGCMRTGAAFVEPHAYLVMPQAVTTFKARGYLAEGKLDEAIRMIDESLKVLPGNVDLATSIVPHLDKENRRKEADAIYQRVFKVQDELCREYPKSGFALNSCAWLCALCRRDLDKAQQLSEKAVELEPKNSGYLDTLAEIHFRKGNKEKAIELMKKCLEMRENHSYFKKQLERFQTKGPESDVPDEDDD